MLGVNSATREAAATVRRYENGTGRVEAAAVVHGKRNAWGKGICC